MARDHIFILLSLLASASALALPQWPTPIFSGQPITTGPVGLPPPPTPVFSGQPVTSGPVSSPAGPTPIFSGQPITSGPVVVTPGPTPIFSGQPITTSRPVVTGPIALPSPTCVWGNPVRSGQWDINYATVGPPSGLRDLGAGFEIERSWFDWHKIGNPTIEIISSDWFDYAEYKCQFTCNANAGCLSFLGRRVRNASPTTFECVIFDALIDSSSFRALSPNSGNPVTHAFNKLCTSRKRDDVLAEMALPLEQ